MNMIHCTKLNKNAPALEFPPLPGEKGKRIMNNISQEAWEMWLSHQTILINEYRLNLIDDKAKTFLSTERENFLFGEGSQLPKEFTETP